MIKKLFNLATALVIITFSGCATLDLKTNVKMTRSVWLKPSPKEEKTIYISLKNISEEKLDILPLLKKDLQEKKYTIVNTPDNAQYVLMINILFANNLKEAAAIKNSAGLGVVSGAIAAGSGSNTGDSLLIGAGIALASGIVSSALEDETYRAVVDIVIDEKSKNSDAGKSIMGDGYKEQSTRVLAEAVQTNLKLDKALPILSKKIASQLSNVF